MKSTIGVRVSYFAEVVPQWKRGWRRFVVVEKLLDLNKSNSPFYEIVSRHWTARGAEHRAERRNQAWAALEAFRGDR